MFQGEIDTGRTVFLSVLAELIACHSRFFGCLIHTSLYAPLPFELVGAQDVWISSKQVSEEFRNVGSS